MTTSRRRFFSFFPSLLGSVALLACATTPSRRPTVEAPDLRNVEIESSVFFAGDAGYASSVVVTEAIARDARAVPTQSLVVFLGDNIYPRGLPSATSADYSGSANVIRAQLGALPAAVPAIYVPGNHDWDRESAGGLMAIRREGTLVRSIDPTRFALLPADGCPGPAIRDVGRRLRILALDTQWWLHQYVRADSAVRCPTTDSASIVTALRTELAAAAKADRRTLVIAHHPLISGGAHGGHAGAGNPFRRFLHRTQDVSGTTYRHMIGAFTDAFTATPPFIYASGHDHDLQVLRGGPAQYLLVSGAGAADEVRGADSLSNTLFALGDAMGYMRLDVTMDGRWLLRVYVMNGRDTRLVWWKWLGES